MAARGDVIPYLDVCSGYSAFTQGAVGLGFDCAGYAEIDAFPSALLGHHYGATAPRYLPDPMDEAEDGPRMARIKSNDAIRRLAPSHFGNRVVNFGDFSQIKDGDVGPVQLLTGGTPCQSFSMAGKRLGLADTRGNLTLEFLALARRVRAEWLVWENVHGFLSHDGGRTMGTFLGLLGQLGYGWAYRVLDAQFIRVDGHEGAVPQRRRRVFVVAHLGDTAGPAAVLFDRESLRGDSAPRRRTGQDVAGPVAPSLVSSGRGVERTGETRGQDPVVAVAFGGGNCGGSIDVATTTTTTTTTQRLDFDSDTFIAEVASTLPAGGNASGGDRQPETSAETAGSMLVAHSLRADGFDASEDGTGRGTPLVPIAFMAEESMSSGDNRNLSPTLRLGADVAAAIPSETGWAVRRLTPRECERLMAVPDDFTLIPFRGKPAADGPRYKALGNSQAVNNMRWIARGLADVIRAQGDA